MKKKKHTTKNGIRDKINRQGYCYNCIPDVQGAKGKTEQVEAWKMYVLKS